MSQQKISPSLKYALWAAYDFKCFYHRQPISYDDVCIDHLIPEHLAEKPDELAAVLASVGREPDWSLIATHNLVPSSQSMNARKHAQVLEPNEMIILLDQARGKVAEVERLQKKYEKEKRTDMLRAQLAVAFSNGRISDAEIDGILAGAAAGEDLVRLTSGLEIFDGVPVDHLRLSTVDELLDKPVKLGMDLSEGLPLVNDEGASVEVRTIREYRAAMDALYYADTTFGMKMEAFFITASKLLEALAACRPSSQSFIRTPRVGVCDIHLLPSSVLITLEATDEECDRLVTEFPTVADLVSADKAEIAWVDSMFISVDFLGIRTSLREMLRADLDGDGTEDLLAAVYFNAVEGTLGGGTEPVALSRKSFAEPFALTDMVPISVQAA